MLWPCESLKCCFPARQWSKTHCEGKKITFIMSNGINLWFVLVECEKNWQKVNLLIQICKRYFEATPYELLDWPAQSPDLNPIEHVWYLLYRALRASGVKPTSESDVMEHLQAAWSKVPKTDIKHLIESMSRRCQAVINAKGGTTRLFWFGSFSILTFSTLVYTSH